MRSGSAASASTAGRGAACSTSTNSPRLRLASAACQAGSSAAGRVTMVSNCLVSSRASVTVRVGAAVASVASSSPMRCGASNSTCARVSASTAASTAWRSAPLAGRKPVKTKLPPCTSPAALSAASALLGPGSGTTGWPAAVAAATSTAPGSLMAGVPASLMKATDSPAASRCSTCAAASCSLCACRASSGLLKPRWRSNCALTRVSSQATASTRPSTCTARSVMSARLPIGVATT